MRLIDADVMEKHIMESHVFTGYFKELVQSLIWGEPTADAVEVVRCCDCKYSVVPFLDSEGNISHLYCQHPRQDEDALSMVVDFVDYCSFGKRKGVTQ